MEKIIEFRFALPSRYLFVALRKPMKNPSGQQIWNEIWSGDIRKTQSKEQLIDR
jgi:hypothetical protein